ncbi:MAG: DNA recombination protein RmuC [Candidatus Izemoplasmatales bacterium]|nr:DNA recombination protein RmuC [Candidatus Izemoplasmatales bacterium]
MLTLGEWIIIGLLVLILIIAVVLLFTFRKDDNKAELNNLKNDLTTNFNNTVSILGKMLADSNENNSKQQLEKLGLLIKSLESSFSNLQNSVNIANTKSEQSMDVTKQAIEKSLSDIRESVAKSLSNNMMETEQKLENIRKTVDNSITKLQEENSKKLDEMRNTVDEKLQKTLEERIGKSFEMVSKKLEDVYKGLGEMQTLAIGVGDLKKVLSNVKTRGILGEIQLGSILEEILSVDQYEMNIATKEGSSDRVEFAIKLPGNGDKSVFLPVDAKFPIEDYQVLLDAYDEVEPKAIKAAQTNLLNKIKLFAKTISSKYIDVPNTTEFAIMFLPLEGLFSEVIRIGAFEEVQKNYKVIIAGPTTMAAILNSLHMGFRTLAIQKRSSEVWEVLGAVKTEFANFGNVLEAAQKKITQANDDLDKLVGTRTRAIQKKLQSVTAISEGESKILLPIKEDND